MNEAPRIGLDNVYIAKVLSDDESGIVYDTPVALKGAVNATVNPNSSVETDYADNGAFFAVNNRGNTEMSLEMIDVDPNVLAEILGMQTTNGVTVETAMDQSPYYALMFRVWIAGKDSNGGNRYELFCYAKGKFSVPETGGATKTESMEFRHINVTAQFVSTQYVPNGQDSGTICTHCRTDNPSVGSSTVANWFNAPVTSLSINNNAVTIASATLSGSDVTITGAKGTSDVFNFVSSSVKIGETVIVAESDGTLCKGTATISAASAAPTITVAITEGTPATVTVTNGVKDNYGVGVTPITLALGA